MSECTAAEAAARYDLSPWYLAHLARRGIVRGRKIGPVWLLDAASVAEYMEKPRKPGPRRGQKINRRPRQQPAALVQ